MNAFIKKFHFLLLLLFLACCGSPEKDTRKQEVFVEGEKHIILMNPTVANLRTFLFLTAEGIFPLPEGYRAVGIYHQSAAYDFGLSEKFLKEEGLDNIALLGLDEELTTENLFTENALSDWFYKIFLASEGIIFFGGPDIPPAIYGQQANILTVVTDPHRHYLELSLLYHLLGGYQDENFIPFLEEDPDYRILGICLGMQSMNVATGGSMIQDIPTEVFGVQFIEDILAMDTEQQHRNYYKNMFPGQGLTAYSFHRIRFLENSQMASIAGDPDMQPAIVTSHHQALNDLGKGFKPTAWSLDGRIIEAIEHSEFPNVIGVQFHPEIRALFEEQTVIPMYPESERNFVYIEKYPMQEGEWFHRNFWKHIGLMYH